jgi:hypothetical protein
MTSINDISDLARILRERPEWADTIRSILLGQELLELPERFAKFVELTGENFRLVHQRLERLETDMAGVKTDLAEIKTDLADVKTDLADVKTNIAEIETRMNRMDGRMDNGFGANYAIKVERNIRSIAGQYLNLRRIKVLRGIYSPGDLELEARIEQAEEDGNITPEEIDGLWRSDLILAARDRTTGSDTYIVIETSITVGDSDIARAKARAGTLSSILGQPATPVVIGAIVDADRTASASLEGVAVAIEPESWNA